MLRSCPKNCFLQPAVGYSEGTSRGRCEIEIAYLKALANQRAPDVETCWLRSDDDYRERAAPSRDARNAQQIRDYIPTCTVLSAPMVCTIFRVVTSGYRQNSIVVARWPEKNTWIQ